MHKCQGIPGTPGIVNISAAPSRWPPSIMTVGARAVSWLFSAFMFCCRAPLAARDFGLRVPNDLSVIGIDGHELGEVFGLTTIDQDARGQGALAVRRLLAGLDGVADSEAPDTEYPTRFVIRSSTAVPPLDTAPLR